MIFSLIKFPSRIAHISLHMRECFSLADNRWVFVDSPSEALPCQCVSQHLVHCLSHWIWHVVHWWQQWAFCHLLSSANSMSNYTPATNLITVAEEIVWFNSFQLLLIGPVRSNFTHLRYELPVTFYLSLPHSRHDKQVVIWELKLNVWVHWGLLCRIKSLDLTHSNAF